MINMDNQDENKTEKQENTNTEIFNFQKVFNNFDLKVLPRDNSQITAIVPIENLNIEYIEKFMTKEKIYDNLKKDREFLIFLSQLSQKILDKTQDTHFDSDLATKMIMAFNKAGYFSGLNAVYWIKENPIILISEQNALIVSPKINSD